MDNFNETNYINTHHLLILSTASSYKTRTKEWIKEKGLKKTQISFFCFS